MRKRIVDLHLNFLFSWPFLSTLCSSLFMIGSHIFFSVAAHTARTFLNVPCTIYCSAVQTSPYRTWEYYKTYLLLLHFWPKGCYHQTLAEFHTLYSPPLPSAQRKMESNTIAKVPTCSHPKRKAFSDVHFQSLQLCASSSQPCPFLHIVNSWELKRQQPCDFVPCMLPAEGGYRLKVLIYVLLRVLEGDGSLESSRDIYPWWTLAWRCNMEESGIPRGRQGHTGLSTR